MSSSMAFTVVIPARYGSTRLPAKPLVDLNGKPMIQHVVERALASRASNVIVATDDQRILDAINTESVKVVLTSTEHQSGTDRIWEAIEDIDMQDESVIVNVQGDEPLIPSAVIDQAAKLVSDATDCGVATLCEAIRDGRDIFNANVVKVVVDRHGRALYFSRAPIPWQRGVFDSNKNPADTDSWYRHLGIYAFKYWALKRFVSLPQSSLERLESLEQLRLLENGISIAIAESDAVIPAGVDTLEDVERVREVLASDSSQ
ncbi:MAG: 3-deoxy-manno-octulosonate cytidylyltransferase [Gammaproteobacteria bacterium]|nr:3-deoxy-manno-octulosonate cytidylyltransferase [Gammaproteobacteria bacterium]